jgi:hypothetical protein
MLTRDTAQHGNDGQLAPRLRWCSKLSSVCFFQMAHEVAWVPASLHPCPLCLLCHQMIAIMVQCALRLQPRLQPPMPCIFWLDRGSASRRRAQFMCRQAGREPAAAQPTDSPSVPLMVCCAFFVPMVIAGSIFTFMVGVRSLDKNRRAVELEREVKAVPWQQVNATIASVAKH